MSDDMVRIVVNGTRPRVSFRTADIILCAVRATQKWYEAPLRDFYIPLEFKTCARPGCDEEFLANRKQKFCSKSCSDTASRHVRLVQRDRALECKNGHSRARYGQYPDGCCKECKKQGLRRYRDRRRQRELVAA